MADGDRIIIGQANTASNPGNETSLSRNGDTAGTCIRRPKSELRRRHPRRGRHRRHPVPHGRERP